MIYAILILLLFLFCALKARASRKRIEKLIWHADHIIDRDERDRYYIYGPLSKVSDGKRWRIRCKMYTLATAVTNTAANSAESNLTPTTHR